MGCAVRSVCCTFDSRGPDPVRKAESEATEVISPQLIGGLIAIAGGTLLIAFRSPLSRASRDAQRATFGRLAKYSSQNATPGNTMFVGLGGIAIGAGLILFAPGEPSAADPSNGDATLVRVAAIILGLVELAFGTFVLVRLSVAVRWLERRYTAVRGLAVDNPTEESQESDGDSRAVPPRPPLVATIAIIGLGMGVATVVLGLRL